MLKKVLRQRFLWKLNQFCIHQRQAEKRFWVFPPPSDDVAPTHMQTAIVLLCLLRCFLLFETSFSETTAESGILFIDERNLIKEFHQKCLFMNIFSPRSVRSLWRLKEIQDSFAFVCKIISTITHRWTHIESLFKPTHFASASLWCCDAHREQKNEALINNSPSLFSLNSFSSRFSL